jgi:large subunit ribosomal protein L34e
MVQRVTYRRRHSYNTRSNRIKLVKTPGGKLSVQYRKKLGSPVRCGDCGNALAGVPQLRPKEYARLSKSKKNVTRAYGGNRCAGCVKTRILRAFLLEEQKIVKAVVKQQQAREAASSKAGAKKDGKKTAKK